GIFGSNTTAPTPSLFGPQSNAIGSVLPYGGTKNEQNVDGVGSQLQSQQQAYHFEHPTQDGMIGLSHPLHSYKQYGLSGSQEQQGGTYTYPSYPPQHVGSLFFGQIRPTPFGIQNLQQQTSGLYISPQKTGISITPTPGYGIYITQTPNGCICIVPIPIESIPFGF
ncbi:MAG: hypothetical protein EZS28_005066, partial [Streblomastix strix]